jgi:hypothetical protein
MKYIKGKPPLPQLEETPDEVWQGSHNVVGAPTTSSAFTPNAIHANCHTTTIKE